MRALRSLNSSSARAVAASKPLLVSACLLALGACAALPKSSVGPDPSDLSAYDFDQSIAVADSAWPAADWWTGYGDPQLTVLIEEAVASAPTLRIADARLRQAEAAARQVGARLAPSVSANGAAQAARQSYNLGLPVPQGWDDNGRATLDFNWTLDFWGQNRAALAAATSEAEAARVEASAARLVLSTAIASTYAELGARFAELEAAQDAVTVRTQTLALMTNRHESGLENARRRAARPVRQGGGRGRAGAGAGNPDPDPARDRRPDGPGPRSRPRHRPAGHRRPGDARRAGDASAPTCWAAVPTWSPPACAPKPPPSGSRWRGRPSIRTSIWSACTVSSR